MKYVLFALLVFGGPLAATAFAAGSASSRGAGLLVWMFVGFVALFIVSQLIPGLILSFGLIKGLFNRKKSHHHNHTA